MNRTLVYSRRAYTRRQSVNTLFNLICEHVHHITQIFWPSVTCSRKTVQVPPVLMSCLQVSFQGRWVHTVHTMNNEDCVHLHLFTVLTFEDPFEYICIMFSAPCFTLSSISNCFCKAINLLLLVEQRGSLLGVSGVLGQSVN